MGVIECKPIGNSGLGTPLRAAGVPQAGVAEVQTITGTATGGSGTLSFGGQATAPIAYNASAATIQTALQGLSSIGAGNATCSGGPLGTAGVVVTFAGALAGSPQALITVGAGFTGGTVTVAETTPGVKAYRTGLAPVGSLYIDTTNGVLYQNHGTQALPVWVKVSTE